MIEPISRGVLDTRLRGYDDLMRRRYPPVIASAAKQSTLFLCGEMDCFASLAMTWMGRRMLDTPHVWDMPTR